MKLALDQKTQLRRQTGSYVLGSQEGLSERFGKKERLR